MKTFALLIIIVELLKMNCIADPSQAPKPQSFDWTNRLELSAEQQKLLHLHTKLEGPNLAPEQREKLEAEAKQLSDKLGAATVRRARPGELVMGTEKDVANIFNPSSGNIAFTVSVRGDEEQMGTLKASMGRLTYLPPKGSLRVPNIYWTTPAMTRKD